MRSIFFDVSIPRVLTTQALATVWKGAYFGPTAPVSLQTLEAGELPAEGWIEVKNKVCGICASDLHLVYVDVDPKIHAAALPPRRVYLGHEVVSTVEKVRGEVPYAVGDRVIMKSRFLGPTCHSQGLTPCDACQKGDYCLCQKTCANKGPVGLGGGWGDGYTCHHSEVWRVPDGLTDDQATLVEPLACSVRAVLRRVPKPKERVLVIGCGMIGLGTIQALRALAPSAQVFAAARHPQQQKLATRWGATLVEGDLYRETERICGAEYYEGMFNNNTLLGGFDVIYDCVANQDTLGQSLRMCRAQGAVVMVGVNLSQSRIDLTPILMQEVDLIGAMAHGMERWQSETVSTFELTARLIEEGKLETDGLITHRFDLSRWKEAIAVAANKRSGSVKVVFDFNT